MIAQATPTPAERALLPPWALKAAGVLLLCVLGSVGALRVSGYSPTVEPGAVVAERTLRFEDTADGAVSVRDADGVELARLRGEQGFVRGVLRGIARDRRQHGTPLEAPLRLSLRDDGRLLLSDPATGTRIDLASFGPDNAAVFAAWLPSPPSSGGKTR